MSIRSFKSLIVASLLTASVASAATDGTVTLSGTVTSTLAMTYTPSNNTGMDLMSASTQVIKVAAIAASTNNDGGLTLTITSDGTLEKTGGAAISFRMDSVVGGASAPSAFAEAIGFTHVVGNSAAGDYTRDLYIQLLAPGAHDPGLYEGTIGLVVTDNTKGLQCGASSSPLSSSRCPWWQPPSRR